MKEQKNQKLEATIQKKDKEINEISHLLRATQIQLDAVLAGQQDDSHPPPGASTKGVRDFYERKIEKMEAAAEKLATKQRETLLHEVRTLRTEYGSLRNHVRQQISQMHSEVGELSSELMKMAYGAANCALRNAEIASEQDRLQTDIVSMTRSLQERLQQNRTGSTGPQEDVDPFSGPLQGLKVVKDVLARIAKGHPISDDLWMEFVDGGGVTGLQEALWQGLLPGNMVAKLRKAGLIDALKNGDVEALKRGGLLEALRDSGLANALGTMQQAANMPQLDSPAVQLSRNKDRGRGKQFSFAEDLERVLNNGGLDELCQQLEDGTLPPEMVKMLEDKGLLQALPPRSLFPSLPHVEGFLQNITPVQHTVQPLAVVSALAA